ncbi:MAG: OmpA family protein [Bacteroidales bacterium]|nr:OmpA family protein [Bacteroidales bacterium]
MKKVILVIASVLALSAGAFAQDTFYPGLTLGLKGGVGYTVGEGGDILGDFMNSKLFSPAAALDLGYQISPVFGLRLDVNGWQGKGWVVDSGTQNGYDFTFAQAGLDATFDIRSMFNGYKARVFNPYVFLGVAGVGYIANGADKNRVDRYWDPVKISTAARAGIGADFRLSDLLAIELEYAYNAQSDDFNSKNGSFLDHQHNVLAGLKFNFGQAAGAKKAAEAAAAAAAAAAAQAAAAAAREQKELDDAIAEALKAIENAEKALAENDFLPEDVAAINDAIAALKKAIEDKDIDAIKAGTKALNDAVDAARKNLADKIEADKKAAEEKAAAEKAAYEQARADALAAAQAAKAKDIVYYVIGKWDIRNQERYKINNLLKKLNADPNLKAVLVGFADRETGTTDGNWVLSENRAHIVAEALEAAGIAPERIEQYWFGDTERISKIAEKNRATVLLTK